MEHKMVIIPFDLETAKRIREGKISGRIVTEKGYKGYRNDVFDRPIEKDYRLSRPTKIKKIGKKSID
jgi:hypothetical protein